MNCAHAIMFTPERVHSGAMSAVAYFVFNRPNVTRQSWESIRAARPRRLFLVADGPRADHAGDVDLCQEVREVVGKVDWPCDVQSNFAPTNLGLRRRMITGLDWAFNQSEELIVLEDDCVAHPDFFRFCSRLLSYYATDHRVTAITGSNFQNGRWRGDGSYYFSKYLHVWGWAAWRRSWRLYDPHITFWDELVGSSTWDDLMTCSAESRYWKFMFEQVKNGRIGPTWDYQWLATMWSNGGRSIVPNRRLISNVGFGSDSTNTRRRRSSARLPSEGIEKLVHPTTQNIDREADEFTFRHHYWDSRARLSQLVARIRS